MTPRVWVISLLAQSLACLALGPVHASATPIRSTISFHIESWDTDRGLPDDSVTAVTQAHDGYLWFGTLNGLVRFDGTRFDVFDENNTAGLDSSQIVCLFEDMQRNLWVGTRTAGIVRVNPNGDVVSLGIGQGASEKSLAAGCVDTGGAVWLHLADGQLWRAEQDRLTPFVFNLNKPSISRMIIAETSGLVWVGTDDRLAAISPLSAPGGFEPRIDRESAVSRLDFILASRNGGHWRLADDRVQLWRDQQLVRDFGSYPWNRAPVAAACEDSQGRLVVGTLGTGVFWLDPDGGFTRISTLNGLSHNIVLSLCMDEEGNLWVGTDGGGLNRVRRRLFDTPDARLRVPAITSVSEDARGGVWIASNGGGVACWQNGVLQQFGYNQGLTNPHVWSVFVDRDQRVWAGTWEGGLFILEGRRFAPAPGSQALPSAIFAIFQDRQNGLWVGTRGGLAAFNGQQWRMFTTAEGLSADEVRAIADDGEGNLWIGTVGGGLNRLRDGRITVFRRADGLPSDDVSSLYVDTDNVVWIGTFGGGLGRFETGQWTRYTTRQGLAGNSIGTILEDDDNDLWIGSNAGIMRVPKRQLNDLARDLRQTIHCRTYSKTDGLPTRQCTIGSQPGGCRGSDGRVWFATGKGIASAMPVQLTPNPRPPPVVIQSVLIDGQPPIIPGVRPRFPSPVVMPARSERLEIQFASLNLGAPDRSLFRYRLESHEKEWTEPARTRSVAYTRLPPGRYRFQVTACNEDGLWNEAGATLDVIVQPPFWRTWWFLGSATALLLAGIIRAVYYLSTQRLQRQLARLKQKETLEKERSRIARDLHDQLGASLTQVALLGELVECDRNQPDEVGAHAQQISQTARETTRVLDEIVWAVNPDNDTLDSLATYLCKHVQEYLALAGLRCRIDLPANIPPTPIPPEVRHNVFLAAKEAVTNVVRHAHATEARFHLQIEPGWFAIEISDNGRGLAGLDPIAAQSRHGLANMRQRIETVDGSFSITDAPQGGCVVRLTAPLA